MKCGLIGAKLSHSYSPEIHKALVGDLYSYELIEMPEEAVGAFVASQALDAYNVTIPYKKTVMPYLDIISERAKKIGAVNTVFKNADGKLCGDNTDYYGFSVMLDSLGVDVKAKKVLILGSGGASATAQAVLSDKGALYTVISRSGEDNYENIYERHANASLIVNCSPVGMYPNTDACPVDLSKFPALEGVLDMIYNPARTRLIAAAEALGIPTINGLCMLVAQAKEACEKFCGGSITVDDSNISRICAQIAKRNKNIVLIGMPGSGKSTIGKLLAEQLGRRFIDTDEVIVERAGVSIPEIFARDGEESFRLLEEEVCADICKLSGCVIATGGGVVTREKNHLSLRQNSDVVFL